MKEKPSEISIGSMPLALGYVARNRNGGAPHLGGQSVEFVLRKHHGRPIYRRGKLPRFLPYSQLSVRRAFRHKTPSSPSIRKWPDSGDDAQHITFVMISRLPFLRRGRLSEQGTANDERRVAQAAPYAGVTRILISTVAKECVIPPTEIKS